MARCYSLVAAPARSFFLADTLVLAVEVPYGSIGRRPVAIFSLEVVHALRSIYQTASSIATL
jgi:hypothetical protein